MAKLFKCGNGIVEGNQFREGGQPMDPRARPPWFLKAYLSDDPGKPRLIR
jgi:hypothetical protein